MNKQPKTSHLTPWKPGQSGNPLGRPQGTRSKFSEAACADALADWNAQGKEAGLAKATMTDVRNALQDRGMVREYAGIWKVNHNG